MVIFLISFIDLSQMIQQGLILFIDFIIFKNLISFDFHFNITFSIQCFKFHLFYSYIFMNFDYSLFHNYL
jgi:hypothetical protein